MNIVKTVFFTAVAFMLGCDTFPRYDFVIENDTDAAAVLMLEKVYDRIYYSFINVDGKEYTTDSFFNLDSVSIPTGKRAYFYVYGANPNADMKSDPEDDNVVPIWSNRSGIKAIYVDGDEIPTYVWRKSDNWVKTSGDDYTDVYTLSLGSMTQTNRDVDCNDNKKIKL